MRITLWHPHLRMDCFCHSLNGWVQPGWTQLKCERFLRPLRLCQAVGLCKVSGDEAIFTSLDVINCNHMCQGQNASCTLARRSCPDVRILLCRCSDSQIHGGMIITFLYDSMTVCCLVLYPPHHMPIWKPTISHKYHKFVGEFPFIFSMQLDHHTPAIGVYNWPWRVSTTGKACHQRNGGTA